MALNAIKNKGQVTLEYFILFLIVVLGIISSGFLWFNWSNGQANADGQARNIAQDYFTGMSTVILGNNTTNP